ncbi:MAG: hypothetical protein PVJ57_00775 [Phycisphaerae bacterium]|jgi:hypothetical protein
MNAARICLFALALLLLAGCAASGPATSPELAHRLDEHLGQPCQDYFLGYWGHPRATRHADDGLVLTWDRPEAGGRALWRLTFDDAGVLRSYHATLFAACVNYGQVTW